MIPLIEKPLFDRLRALRSKLPEDPAYVFVPVSQPTPDLLFIGQATSGMVYDEDLDYAAATQECAEMLTNFSRVQGRRAFWHSVRRIRDQVSRIARENDETATVGWSNLCKIGAEEGNPTQSSIDAQSELCVAAIKQELQTAKAKVTIFLTGDFASAEILLPAVGNDWRNNVVDLDRVAVNHHCDYGLLLWAYHPNSRHGMKHLRELEGFIAGFAAASILHHRNGR